jgi:L-alanine-DL-glutamate epimerase-like enolase superfamily enzyme
MRQLSYSISHWPLAKAFVISRGARTQADVVQVMIDDAGQQGFGECVPYSRYGESLDSVATQIDSVKEAITQGASRKDLLDLLPAGAARNALDCALWDLEAHQQSVSVGELSQMGKPGALISAQTISVGSPEEMAREAEQYKNYPLLKAKMDKDLVLERLTAIHRAAPGARLIIDANEAWTIEQLNDLTDHLIDLGVVLIEQPLPADQDQALMEYRGSLAICADESCHTTKDIADLAGRYQAINIKLDKTGGLTEAIEVLKLARQHQLSVMVGCMVGTSLAMAPATIIAQHADYVDLDGPALLAEDVANGFHYKTGEMSALPSQLWGN